MTTVQKKLAVCGQLLVFKQIDATADDEDGYSERSFPRVIAGWQTVILTAVSKVNRVSDGRADELHAAVTHQEICARGMIRTKPPREIPIGRRKTLGMKIALARRLFRGFCTRCHRIERNGYCRMRIILTIIMPPASIVVDALTYDFSHEECVGCAVSDGPKRSRFEQQPPKHAGN